MARRPGHDDVVTGEAVALSLPVAGPTLRAASGVIDLVAEAVLLVVCSLITARVVDGLDDALVAGIFLLLTLAVLIGVPIVSEALTARTLGKAILGLRTVRDDGAPADLRRIATRHLVGFVELWALTGVPALVSAVVTDPTRRLGDLAAGTYVVRARVPLRLPPAPRMPPTLEAWTRNADLGRIPDDLTALVRTTLAQGAEFDAASGQRVRAMLAERLTAHVTPPPPAGTPPDDVITAVMAERRRRDLLRLRTQEARRARLFGAPGTASPTHATRS